MAGVAAELVVTVNHGELDVTVIGVLVDVVTENCCGIGSLAPVW